MITVAVANLSENRQQALQYIHDTSKQQGIKILSITPSPAMLYKHHKKIRLKKYIDDLAQSEKPELLMVNITREALLHQVYEGFNFNIMLLCDSYYEARGISKKNYITSKLIKKLHSNYYVLPDTCSFREERCLTYGWSNRANISASSVQKNIEGGTSLQCCIQSLNAVKDYGFTGVKEFSVRSASNDVEGVLASIATMALYDMNRCTQVIEL